jgi:hypothetical protein
MDGEDEIHLGLLGKELGVIGGQLDKHHENKTN